MKLECNFLAGSARILNGETVMDVIKEKTKELVSISWKHFLQTKC